MGTDIHGWVEIRLPHSDGWSPVIDAGLLLDRNYAMFGALFGVRNHGDFSPVAAGRGLPPDTSQAVRAEAEPYEEDHSHTWVSWDELTSVDWDEMAFDGLVRGYREGETDSDTGTYLDRSDPRREPPREWKERGLTWRVARVPRRETLRDDCRMLFEMMRLLAEQYGDASVRLVVWFDD